MKRNQFWISIFAVLLLLSIGGCELIKQEKKAVDSTDQTSLIRPASGDLQV